MIDEDIIMMLLPEPGSWDEEQGIKSDEMGNESTL
jgi:hypothetical protein